MKLFLIYVCWRYIEHYEVEFEFARVISI